MAVEESIYIGPLFLFFQVVNVFLTNYSLLHWENTNAENVCAFLIQRPMKARDVTNNGNSK